MSLKGGKLKIVMLGSSTVGKTCLIERYVYSTFSSTKTTIGLAFTPCDIKAVDGTTINVGIWDTAGQERFESTLKQYYQNADAALICFNPLDPQTWQKAKYWANEIMDVVPGCIICIVATKSDLWSGSNNPGKGKMVNISSCKRFARSIQAPFFETSAKADKGVAEPFIHAAQEAYNLTQTQPKTKTNVLNLSQPQDSAQPQKQSQSSGCC